MICLTVFKSDVKDLFTDRLVSSSFPAEESGAVIVLVPVRLGSSRINPLYIPCVKDLLTIEYSLVRLTFLLFLPAVGIVMLR